MKQVNVFFDFETRSAVDLKAAGADVYARSETTDALCLAYAINDGPVHLWKLGDPAPFELFMELEAGAAMIAHNAAFEYDIWNKCCAPKYGWPELPHEQLYCTMTYAYALNLPGSLENCARALGIDKQKDMKGHRIMLQLSKPRKVMPDGEIVWWTVEDVPEKYAATYDYCVQDLLVERELLKRLRVLSPIERKLWILDQKINQRGVYIDAPAVKAAIDLLEMEKRRLNAEMKDTTNSAVSTFNAVGQIRDWLQNQGIETPGVTKADVVTLLEREHLPERVRRALQIRQEGGRSSTAKLAKMLSGISFDGRVRGSFQYHGAGQTGRWAGRRIQLHNLPRPTISQKNIEAIIDLLGKVGA